MSPGDLAPLETMSGQAFTNFHDKSQNVKLPQPRFKINQVRLVVRISALSCLIKSRPTTVHAFAVWVSECIHTVSAAPCARMSLMDTTSSAG